MNNQNNIQQQTLTYIIDPVCGWCYGSLPSIKQIAKDNDFKLEIMPSGVFCKEHALQINQQVVEYIWKSCQRIQAMTNQPFSTAFRDNILLKLNALDSYWPTLALVIAKWLKLEIEQQVALLDSLQSNLNYKGIDVTNSSILLEVLNEEGFANIVAVIKEDNSAILAYYQTLINQTRQLMTQHNINGVPALLHNGQVLDNSLLYLKPEESIIKLKAQ